MTQKERIEQLEKEVQELRNEMNLMRQLREQRRKERLARITDTEITLTDSLNDEDKYAIKIMSGHIITEKVGE